MTIAHGSSLMITNADVRTSGMALGTCPVLMGARMLPPGDGSPLTKIHLADGEQPWQSIAVRIALSLTVAPKSTVQLADFPMSIAIVPTDETPTAGDFEHATPETGQMVSGEIVVRSVVWMPEPGQWGAWVAVGQSSGDQVMCAGSFDVG